MLVKIVYVTFVALFVTLAECATRANDSDTRTKFENWQKQHDIHYNNTADQDARYQNFQQNLKFIEDFKKKESLMPGNFTLALNRLAGMSQEEVAAKRFGYKRHRRNATTSSNNGLALLPNATTVDDDGDDDGNDNDDGNNQQPIPQVRNNTANSSSIRDLAGRFGRRRNNNDFTDFGGFGGFGNYNGGSSPSSSSSSSSLGSDSLPSSVDWRTSGAVTAVRDQGSCGCCWAMTAVGALEGAYKIKYGTLRTFSPKNLMDCSWSYGNEACNGGWMIGAFQYVRAKGGINLESAYPWRGSSSRTCRFNSQATYAKLADKSYYAKIPSGNEAALKAAVAKGPVAIAMDASSMSFQYYSSGVYSDYSCSKSQLNHGMLVVGYGTDARGGDYWLVKNSWGTWWGEKGYIRMARGRNVCGIATDASYPVLA